MLRRQVLRGEVMNGLKKQTKKLNFTLNSEGDWEPVQLGPTYSEKGVLATIQSED